jgi:A1 cistron-splicing factor AAR2
MPLHEDHLSIKTAIIWSLEWSLYTGFTVSCFVHYHSSVSKEGQTGPRTGFFHFFKPREVLVKRWDPKVEDLTESTVSEEMVEGIKQNLMGLDASLGPYPYESLKRWVSLTNYVEEAVVARVQPQCGKISSVAKIASSASKEKQIPMKPESMDTTSVSDDSKSPDEHFAGVGTFPLSISQPGSVMKKMTRDENFSLQLDPDHVLRFSEISKRKYPPGSSPSDITKYSMDHSYVLSTMMKDVYHSSFPELLGELQIAFVSFLIGHVFDAFEWWKSMVTLLCFSDEALSQHKDLFTGFISSLHFQLQEIPSDFFIDIVTKDNFLTITLQTFFSNLEQSKTADRSLVKRGLQFRENLSKKYNWDFSADPLDSEPTIVEDI